MEKIKKIAKEMITDSVTEKTVETAVNTGIEVATAGVKGFINGIFLKVIGLVFVIVLLVSAGCVGTNMLVSETKEVLYEN